MPYLRRLVLLLTISTSILLVTMHLLHMSRTRHADPLHPVLSKEEADQQFKYLKEYDHPPPANPIVIPSPEVADKLAHGDAKPDPPKKEEVLPPAEDEDILLRKKLYGKLPPNKIPPANATAWHKDRNLWKVKDALDV